MSDTNQEVEQITTTPTITSPKSQQEAKPKDPKKVSAGKRLAEYNRRAKEALKKEVKCEEEQSMEQSTGEGSSNAWIPEISFATILSVVGVGLTVLDLLMRYRANAATGGYHANAVTEGYRNSTPTESKTCEGASRPGGAEWSPTEEGSVYPKTRQATKFGMD